MKKHKDVAVVAFTQSVVTRDAGACNEVELIMPVIREALDRSSSAVIEW